MSGLRVGSPEHNALLLEAVKKGLEAWRDAETICSFLEDALPVQGNVTPLERVKEAVTIVEWWPDDHLEVAMLYHADWHSLLEPARWMRIGDASREEILAFALDFASRKTRWPKADEMRRRFGKASGHRLAGEDDSQEVMPV